MVLTYALGLNSSQVQVGMSHHHLQQQQQQHFNNNCNLKAPLSLPRLSATNNNTGPNPRVAASRQSSSSPASSTSSSEKSIKATLPLSPLATGVTVTNNPSPSTYGDTLTRPTKYVTRPQTPATPVKPQLASGGRDWRRCQYDPPLPLSRSRPPLPAGSPSTVGDEFKFAVRPPPTLVFPDAGNVTTWHASLPRLARHQPEMQVSQSYIFITCRLTSPIPIII